MSEPLALRILRDGAEGGALNMARDEALARCLRPGEAVLRLYAWERPTVSFGRNEPVRELYARDAAGASTREARAAVEAAPPDFVRRTTGGRAVLHDAEVTYAVVVPVAALGGPREAYRRINEALATGLRSLGAEVAIAGEDGGAGITAVGALPLDAGPCFRTPAPGEVTALGRKLVGSAQARIGRALLQHGSVILRGDPARLTAAVPGAPNAPSDANRPATLHELIGPIDRETVAAALADAVAAAFGGRPRDSGYTEEESATAARLAETRYDRPEWTWRR